MYVVQYGFYVDIFVVVYDFYFRDGRGGNVRVGFVLYKISSGEYILLNWVIEYFVNYWCSLDFGGFYGFFVWINVVVGNSYLV